MSIRRALATALVIIGIAMLMIWVIERYPEDVFLVTGIITMVIGVLLGFE